MKCITCLTVTALLLAGCGKAKDHESAPNSGYQAGQGCLLSNPVPLKADPLAQRVTFHQVELEKPIQARNFEMPASKEELSITFYNIEYAATMGSDWVKTGFLGFALNNLQTAQSTGFADLYAGNSNVDGTIKTDRSLKVYTTTDKDHGTNLNVIVDNGKITSIEFMIDGKWNCVKSMFDN